jgi:hypothetical protein
MRVTMLNGTELTAVTASCLENNPFTRNKIIPGFYNNQTIYIPHRIWPFGQ